MKISYKWLREYLPEDVAFGPYINDEKELSKILTAVGLEVEGLEAYQSVRGGLAGLIVGEVMTCEKHPNADRLKITTVNTGTDIKQIICGAPNVAAGQKVVLALPGTQLFPLEGDPFIIKKSKIRSVESLGMICAEDEIGLGSSHEGIIILPDTTPVGIPVSEVIPVYEDYIFEIGLTPNRMDDQSHLGVAKDVCAWLTFHTGKTAKINSPLGVAIKTDERSLPIKIEVKDAALASRYAGVSVRHIRLGASPQWMQNRLKVMGVKPINNIVDITNYVLHATGQPLHAFDADKIAEGRVVVETLSEGTPFVTLDGKERKLTASDIMICDGRDTPMCIAGVFGGLDSGISETTRNIFLESAVFNPVHIRKSIIKHDLRTDAAARFEKGVDASKTVEVLKYAASLIKEICKGEIGSDIVDIYTQPAERIIELKYDYLRKLSGRDFEQHDVENILTTLGFEIRKSDVISIVVKAPESNPDISLPADIVEEILRISGLDNIPIPDVVKMTPGTSDNDINTLLEEKISAWLTGNGFFEIFTNSITNEKYYSDHSDTVRILNSLSRDLTILRKEMLPTALEAIEYNIKRQNRDLSLFEWGKTYRVHEDTYQTDDHLCLYCTGQHTPKSWNSTETDVSFFYLKGIANGLFAVSGVSVEEKTGEDGVILFLSHDREIGRISSVPAGVLEQSDIRQPVFYLDIDWALLKKVSARHRIVYHPVSKFPTVSRDISMILDNKITYGDIERIVMSAGIKKLTDIRMFDLYQSDKLGKDKKSIAMSFSFTDEGKTLTDKETDKMMQHIIRTLEDKYHAEIRSHA